jgi:hypothetical protein
MPIYSIKAPDGNIYDIRGPEDATPEQLFSYLSSQLRLESIKPKPQEGIMAALKGGFKRFGSELETAAESLIDPELAAKRGLERQREISEQYAPGASLEKVKQAYEERGLFPAAKEAISQIPSAVAEQAPNIASALGGAFGGARLGAMAGSAFGPVGTGVGAVAGGLGGAFIPSFTQQYASGLERQAEEKVPEISRSAAAAAAVPGAALEVASTLIPLGRGFVGKLLGPRAEAMLATGSSEAVERAARETVFQSLGRGAAVGSLTEIPTEVAQQMLERAQAGLPLTDENALKEYGEAAYGAALVGTPFGAAGRALGRPAAREAYERQQEAEIAALTPAPAEIDESALPGGYRMVREELGKATVPSGFNIMAEGQESPLSTLDTEEEAVSRIAAMTEIRKQEQATLLAKIDQERANVQKDKDQLMYLEATGQGQSPEAQQLRESIPIKENQASDQIAGLTQRINELEAPISVVPAAPKDIMQERFHVISPDQSRFGTFETAAQAQEALKQKIGEEPFKRAEAQKAADEFARTVLIPQLKKFGLHDVGLKIEQDMKEAGAYSSSLIRLAMDEQNPLQTILPTMRHEAMHALKNLGFFTPQQMKALEQKAEKEWVDTYLKGQNATHEGQTMSRYDAYVQIFTKQAQEKGLSGNDLDNFVKESILEEAIADAFGAYDKGVKPPPGMIAALFKKIKNFFANFKQAMQGAGFESADDIFQSIERGRLKQSKEAKPAEEKLSLGRVPLSTRGIMESNDKFAQSDLGLETEKLKGATGANNVRDIGLALNNKTINEHGQIKDTSLQSAQKLGDAIADEVGWQLNSTAKTGTGLGWYSNNYPNALTILGNRFPELKDSRHARSVFSAIVAVTSNGEDVSTNIKNAIKLYEKLRDGKSVKAIGSRRGTALENNLTQIQALLEKFGTNFEKELMREITVADMNAYLRSIGEKPDGSYLKDVKVPAAAIYFGPKLGAFYANLMGAEGYLTMDMWWTRSINRMRGLLKPEATESSIKNFRGLIDQPNATINQVLEIAAKYRNKYDDHGYVTDLEFLAGSKEPSKKVEKELWFKQAEKKAGNAYDQLLFEHRLEKLSNTIYKNEVEMLEEAPFNASDRKFMYDAARFAQKKLRDDGVNLSIADIQAALWYYEKRLYAKLAGRKADDIGYEEAIIDSAAGARRARPSVVFSDESHRWNVPRTESAVSDQLGAKTEEKQKVKGEEREAARPEQPAERPSPRGKLSIQRGGDRGRRDQGGGIAPLAGAPIIEGATGADPRIVKVAEDYAKKIGLTVTRQPYYATIDEDRARRIAQAYDEMKHEPQDPKVKEAYRDLIKQTKDQYKALIDAGYEFTFFDGATDPYGGNPWNAMRDLRQNQRMAVYGTYDGYGTEGITGAAIEDNPMLEDTGLRWPDQGGVMRPVTANDLFRAVHDAFGHGIEGAGFRAQGEENAWQAHVRLFVGPAVGAITSETRGQNSWLNYGPYGDKNRTAKLEDTVFAEQKTGLMPEWTWTEGRIEEPEVKPVKGIVLGTKQPGAISVKGSHYGNARVDELDATKYGTGLRGAERRRLDQAFDDRIKRRVYLYIKKDDGSTPTPEAGVGNYVYTQQFDNILGPGAEMSRLFREARGDSNDFESNVIDAGYDGYAVPSMGMMVILNHNVPVNYVGPMAEVGSVKLSIARPKTEAFKKWFGDSDAVDENGSPLIVYTATNKDFTVFEPGRGVSKDAISAWVTSDKDFVNNYASVKFRWWKTMHRPWEEDRMVPSGLNIIPAYVNPKNPFDVTSLIDDLSAPINDAEAEKVARKLNVSKAQLLNAIPEKDVYPNGLEREHTKISADLVRTRVAVDAMRKLGFDSVKAREAGSVVYALFDSDQIKSAISNIGTYSGPDIRYSLKSPDTPEFKRWFRDSKIVNEDGSPMVMYHGTRRDFTTPETRGNRNAFFVSPDPNFANKYALNDLDWSPDKKGFGPVEEGAQVYPVYISAKNPFDYENADHFAKIIPKFRKVLKEQEGFDRSTIEDLVDELRDGRWTSVEFANDYDLFELAGFDAFYTKEMGRKNLGVLYPNQIKSAIGNNGTYSSKSSDIRYSLKNVGFPSVKAAKEAVAKTSVPETSAFKRFIGASQWVDEDGKAKVFYHATAGEFFEFTPAGSSQAIFLAETPEEAETFGSVAEDRVRRQIYKALNKEEKQDLFMRVLAGAAEKGTVSDKQAEEFIRSFKRKTPEYGDFGDIEQETYDALLDLSPSKMTIMPLYARAETPFDFENQDHVRDVINWVANNGDIDKANPEKWLANLTGRIKQGSWQAIENKDVQRGIRAMGHDGFTIRENKASPKNYAVYQPNQLKSVTGNDGQFSLETGDIRYSLKPMPQVSAAAAARINIVSPPKVEKGWVQRMLGALGPDQATNIRQKLLNRYERLAEYDKILREQIKKAGGPALLADQSAESAALMSDLAAGVTASAIGTGTRKGGIPVYRNGYTTIDSSVKGLAEALAPLAQYGDPDVYRHYQFWAGWKRGRRLLSEGRERLYEPADIKHAQELERLYPEFVQVQKDLNAFNDGIVEYAVQTGVLSRERANLYKQYSDYIPFYRQLDMDRTIGPNPFHGLVGVKGPEKLKGGEEGLADFLETMVRNTQSMINSGMKNAAAQKATKVAERINAVDRLAGPPAGGLGFDVYTQLENGQLVYYRSGDPLFMDAVKSLNIPELPFISILSKPANALRSLVTKDPGFMMANLLRDSLSAYVTSGQRITPIVGTMVNFGKGLTKGSPGMEALFNSGVIGGYEFSQNIEQSGKSLETDLSKKAKTDAAVLRPFKSLWEGLERGTTASDAATRVAVYERVLAETGNEAEALFRAAEVMNFNRKGNSALIRIATAAIPFFNARLQGLDLFYRASTGQMNTSDAKEIQRRFWIRGATMMSLSVMYYMAVAGDDEYEKQEQETKDNNWIFPSLGIRIPTPFEVGTLFKTMPERTVAYLFGNDTGKDFVDATKRAIFSTFGFNPIPQTFKPIIEASTNYNFFTMRPIIGKGMEDVAPEYQIGPGTSKVAEGMAKAINSMLEATGLKLTPRSGASPMIIDQLIKGYTGTMGQYATDIIDSLLDRFDDSPKASKRFEQTPVLKRFLLDPAARGTVTDYYDLKNSVDTTVRTMNLLERTARPEEFADFLQKNAGILVAKDYVRDLEKSMKELREMRGLIQASSMDGDSKRDALLSINEGEANLTRNIQQVKKAISQLK